MFYNRRKGRLFIYKIVQYDTAQVLMRPLKSLTKRSDPNNNSVIKRRGRSIVCAF